MRFATFTIQNVGSVRVNMDQVRYFHRNGRRDDTVILHFDNQHTLIVQATYEEVVAASAGA